MIKIVFKIRFCCDVAPLDLVVRNQIFKGSYFHDVSVKRISHLIERFCFRGLENISRLSTFSLDIVLCFKLSLPAISVSLVDTECPFGVFIPEKKILDYSCR